MSAKDFLIICTGRKEVKLMLKGIVLDFEKIFSL